MRRVAPRVSTSGACLAAVLATGCATGTVGDAHGAAPPAAPARVLDVDVTVLPAHTDAFGGLALRYCPVDGALPRRLRPENRRALPFLVAATDEDGRALVVDDDGVRTRDLAGCAVLTLDVARLADTLDDKDLAQRVGDDVIATPDLWLWRPEPLADDARLRVRVERAGFDVAVPWVDLDDGRFVVPAQAFALKSDAAFGRFTTEAIDAGGARLALARLDDGRAPPALARWLAASAHAVASVHGAFPAPRLNVLVVPTHVARPIVVGFYSRGGGPTATFYVGDGAADLDEGDLEATGRWALTHELAHALLPPVKGEDAWLNEGIATWYQDLLARRAGMLPDDAAYWAELVRGLRTGRERSHDDRLTVAEASRRMHATGAYQHTYWAGVALVLLAEVEAQRQGASLDDLVRALRRRFPRDDRPRTARALLGAIDEGKGAVAARALERAYLTHKDEPWPDVDAVLAELGVMVDGVGAVTLDERAPLAAIRHAITHPTALDATTRTARVSPP